MPRLPDSVVGDAYTSTFAWEVLEDLVAAGNRMAGSEGEAEGARVLERAFGEAGLRDVGIEEFDVPGWWRGSSSIAVDPPGEVHGRDHHVIALPGSPAGTVEAELVDEGFGVPGEIGDGAEGAVVMANDATPEGHDRGIHRMEKYAAAVDAGAAGFVFRTRAEGCLPRTGEIGYHARPGAIPATSVSRELGARLERRADGSTVELSVDARNGPATSPNVEGAVGPDTGEEVLVTAHVDAHDIAEGAGDNGVGSALLAEVGRLLSGAEDLLETRVRLVAFGSEEIGMHGAYHAAGTLDPDRVKCVLNVDGAGDSRDPSVGPTNGFDGMVAPVRRAAERLGPPPEIEGGVVPHTDAWPFAERGVPALTVGSVTPEGERGARGWGHTHADTLDKLDPRDVRALAAIVAEAAVELADDGVEVPRRDPEDVYADIDEGYERELRVGGRWHR